MISIGFDAAQFTPIKVQPRKESLGVQTAGIGFRLAFQHRKQTAPLDPSRNLDMQNLQDGRHQVGEIHQALGRSSLRNYRDRKMKNERNMQRGIVDKKPVRLL